MPQMPYALPPGNAPSRFKEVGKRVMRASSSMETFEAPGSNSSSTWSSPKLASLRPTTAAKEAQGNASMAKVVQAFSDAKPTSLGEDMAKVYHAIGKDLVAAGATEAAWGFFRHAINSQRQNDELSSTIMNSLLSTGGRLLAPAMPLTNCGRLLEALISGKAGMIADRSAAERRSYSGALAELEEALVEAGLRERGLQQAASAEKEKALKEYMATHQAATAKSLGDAAAKAALEREALGLVLRRELGACEAECTAAIESVRRAASYAQQAAQSKSAKADSEAHAAKTAVGRLAEQARLARQAAQAAEEAAKERERLEAEARKVAWARHEQEVVESCRREATEAAWAEARAAMQLQLEEAEARAKAEGRAALEAEFESALLESQAALQRQLEEARASMQRQLDESQSLLQQVAARAEEELDRGMEAANRIAAEAEASLKQTQAEAARREAAYEAALKKAGVTVVHVEGNG